MKDTHPLYEWIFEIRDILAERIPEKQGNFIVLVAWGSASGKTSLIAKRIQEQYKDESILLSMDNYYRGWDYYKKHNLNFDQPEALNLDLFFEHLSLLKEWKTVRIPEYDFKNGKPIMDAIEVAPKKVIIVEWLFALHEKIEKVGDFKVFVDLGTHGRILRRIFRDVTRTWQNPNEILKYFLDTVEPMHQKYIEPTIESADIVVSNEYIPFIESRNTRFKEFQLKFDITNENKEYISELLLSNGWDYLWRNNQEDTYFNPRYKDNSFDLDDEIVMIRRFSYNDRYILTYKGPNYETEVSERYVLSFFIDTEVYESFKDLNWEETQVYTKERSNYYFYGNLFSVDVFESWEVYLEVRIKDDSKVSMKELESILTKMWLDMKAWKSDSYLEIFSEK